MMALVLITSMLLGTVLSQGSADNSWTPTKCLYCKRKDTNAGFLYTYTYCKDGGDDEACIADFWTYILPTRSCLDAVEAYKLDVDEDCRAEDNGGNCRGFESSEDFFGQYVNDSFTL